MGLFRIFLEDPSYCSIAVKFQLICLSPEYCYRVLFLLFSMSAIESGKYVVVEFLGFNCVDVVPNSWVGRGEKV